MTALNQIATEDFYTPAATLIAARSTRVLLHVRNAAIYYQLGHGWSAITWDEEVFMPPGTGSYDRDFDAVRVRSAAAGAPARVTIDAGTS